MNLFSLAQIDFADATKVLGILSFHILDDLLDQLFGRFMPKGTLHGWKLFEIK